jgi:hypothetical protein
MKKETLEEYSDNYGWRIKTNTFSDPVKANELANSAKQDFTEGAKWQAERMYDDSIQFGTWLLSQDITSRGEGVYVDDKGNLLTVKDLFEQFKKK